MGLEDMLMLPGMGLITLTLELHRGAQSLEGDPGTTQDMFTINDVTDQNSVSSCSNLPSPLSYLTVTLVTPVWK